MIIKTISEAEDFVRNTPKFYWEGWDIVHLTQDDYAEFSPYGVFNRDNGRWYRKTVFSINDAGWNIPDSVIK